MADTSVIKRHYTTAGTDVYAGIAWRTVIGPDWTGYVVPQDWDDAACDIALAQVFCKEPLPALTRGVETAGMPAWLWPQTPDHRALDDISAEHRYRFERDWRAVLDRIAGGCVHDLVRDGHLAAADAETLYDEFRYIMARRIALPETAFMAALGLEWAYGISCAPYTPSAAIADDFSQQGSAVIDTGCKRGIARRVLAMARAGAERPQALTGDDRPQAVTVDVAHADSPILIDAQRQAEIAHTAEVLGRRTLRENLNAVIDACDRDSIFGFEPARVPALKKAVDAALAAGVPEGAVARALAYAAEGAESLPDDCIDHADEGIDALQPAQTGLTVQLGLPDAFIESALTGHSFALHAGGVPVRHIDATRLWEGILDAVWSTGQPRLLFADRTGVKAPGLSGGMIGDKGDAAAYAVINVHALSEGRGFAEKALHHVAVIMACGLAGAGTGVQIGVSGIAASLMAAAMPYDGHAARQVVNALCTIVTAAGFHASALMAARSGSVLDAASEKDMLASLKARQGAVGHFAPIGVRAAPGGLRAARDEDHASKAMQAVCEHARRDMQAAYDAVRLHGLRHRHVSALATHNDLHILLDAPSNDLRPMPALVRFGAKDQAAYGRTLVPSVPAGLAQLGYSAAQIDAIGFYAVGHATLFDAPAINHMTLKIKGFHQAALDRVEQALAGAQDIRYVFNKWTLGEDFCCHMLGILPEALDDPSFDMLDFLGYEAAEIEAANVYCCGTLTLEGAPHLDPDHLHVFDTLWPAGAGVRRVSAQAQIVLGAAADAQLTGCVDQVIALDHYTRIDAVSDMLVKAWQWGAKTVAFARLGATLDHPALTLAGLQDSRLTKVPKQQNFEFEMPVKEAKPA